MKKTMFLVSGLIVLATTILIACNGSTATGSASTVISQDSLVKRGDYLVTTMGCDDCHTSKKLGPNGVELDMEHRLGGHLSDLPAGPIDLNVLKNGWLLFGMSTTTLVGPWGQSFAANLSSDPTGIGNWTEEQFFTALRKGKAKGIVDGRSILPPMPWQNYAKLKDEDIRAIFAYLKTTKPVNNLVPAPIALADLK